MNGNVTKIHTDMTRVQYEEWYKTTKERVLADGYYHIKDLPDVAAILLLNNYKSNVCYEMHSPQYLTIRNIDHLDSSIVVFADEDFFTSPVRNFCPHSMAILETVHDYNLHVPSCAISNDPRNIEALAETKQLDGKVVPNGYGWSVNKQENNV